MRRFLGEFKQFAMRGNVIDLAVGIVIGAAFGKIVNSLVEDLIMPPLGLVISGVDFSDLAVPLGQDPTGQPVLLRYGSFIQTVFEFLVIAFAIFLLVRTINRLKRQAEKAEEQAPPPPPTPTETLLRAIRDLLAKQTDTVR